MQQPFSDLELSKESALYIARGLRALAACDGLSAAELGQIELFESELGLSEPAMGEFQSDGGGPLQTPEQKEVFLRSLLLLALVDGVISGPEAKMISEISSDLGITTDRADAITIESKQFLLGSLAGVQAFRAQAVAVGQSLGLTSEQIEAALAEG